MFRSRLFLITPKSYDPTQFGDILEAALSGGDVASLLITGLADQPDFLRDAAKALTPIAQKHEVAVMVHNDTQAAGYAKADGVHVDTGAENLSLAIDSFHPERMVGAGGVASRHNAMTIGETSADYIFFGRLDLLEHEEAHPKNLAFAEWWAEVFELPAVAMAGQSSASVDAIGSTGIDFVAVRDYVWTHANGPQAAIQEANEILDRYTIEEQ
ncbi:MAG: thiamine phosphate synthase [Stappiaceae bacterium]